MAMTQTALVFMGALAALATLGVFIDFDPKTRIVVTFLASILWGFFGLSAFDVIVVETYYATRSEPITPLAYLGIGLCIIVGLYAFAQIFGAVGNEVGAEEAEGIDI